MVFIAISQLLMVVSVAIKSYPIIVAARLVFGCGYDVMSMSKSILLN